MESLCMKIKFLEEHEKELIINLVSETSSLMRDKNYNIGAYKPVFNENMVYCGAFDDNDVLIAVVQARRWQRLPCYSITKYYSKPGYMTLFSWKNNPAVPITEMIIDLMEKEGRFTWYYVRSIEDWPEKLRIKGNDFFSVSDKCKKYTRYIEEIIKKNTSSVYEGHSSGRPEWKLDLIMVKCCLKNQFRPFEYKFEEDYDSEN